jgi:hypothetical protein
MLLVIYTNFVVMDHQKLRKKASEASGLDRLRMLVFGQAVFLIYGWASAYTRSNSARNNSAISGL